MSAETALTAARWRQQLRSLAPAALFCERLLRRMSPDLAHLLHAEERHSQVRKRYNIPRAEAGAGPGKDDLTLTSLSLPRPLAHDHERRPEGRVRLLARSLVYE